MADVGRFIVAVLAILALVVGVIEIVDTTNDASASEECRDVLAAEWREAVAAALDAPPAPNFQREAAIIDMRRTSERGQRAVELCADGNVKPYKPLSDAYR